MKKQNFLNKIIKERKLEKVNPSEEICFSYLEKANNCLMSGKILLKNSLYENSISMFYYTMYNSLIALLFKVGIKCENHSASILLLKIIFNRDDLFDLISFAKKERIDKQYYFVSKKDFISKDSALDMMKKSEGFLVQIKLFSDSLNLEKIKEIRVKFDSLIKNE